MPTKICPMCGIEKDVNEFDSRSGHQIHLLKSCCRKCNIIKVTEWQKRNPQKHKNNSRNSDLTTKYNITLDEYNKLYLAQNGKCSICEKSYESLVVDHDHKTNVVRGLLCFQCNCMLGNAKEDIIILSGAITYLLNQELKNNAS